MAYLGSAGLTIRNVTVATATEGQSVVPVSGGYDPDYLDVFLNGILMMPPDVTKTNGINVTFTESLVAGDYVMMVAYKEFSFVDAVSRTGGTMTGNLTVPNLNVASGGYVNGLVDLDFATGGVNRLKLNSNGVFRGWYTNNQTISATGTFTFNPALGQVALITATNAITITFGAPTNIVEGAEYKIMVKAGDTGARSYLWNSAYKFPGGIASLSTGCDVLDSYDVIKFIGGPSNTLIYDGHTAEAY